jgi:di/tricarboxylate transporter
MEARADARHPVLPRPNTEITVGAALLVALALRLGLTSLAPHIRNTLSISALVLVLWIGQPIPHAVTGLIGCYLFWSVAGIPFSTAFGGFSNATSWFVLAAGLFGVMATRSGLAHRLAHAILSRAGTSYNRLLLSIILTSFALNLLVPSGIARVIILGGIALGVAQTMGWGKDSVSGRGLFVTLTVAASLFDKMMITGGSSIVAQGYIEKIGQSRVFWSQWLAAHIPTILLSIPACWIAAIWLFPNKQAVARQPGVGGPAPGPWSPAERRCAAFLALAVLLWTTDFLHHIHPAMVALGIGLAAMLPGIGVLRPKELKEFDFMPFLFTASALSLGMGLMESGALDTLTREFGSWKLLEAGFVPSALVLYWTGVAYHILVPSDPTTLATSMPALMNLALARNWSPVATGLTWTLSLVGKIFVYQSGVSIAGYSFGYFRPRDFVKMGLCLIFIEFAILILLLIWYWPFIGLIR